MSKKMAVAVRNAGGALAGLGAETDPAAVGHALTESWQHAQGGLVEILRFGAMCLMVQEWLDGLDNIQQSQSRFSGRGGDHKSGTGLKGWLATHCPGIHYKTAYGYMQAAAGLRREARLAADVPLLALMGEDPIPEKRAEKLRQRVLKVVAKGTLGLLREAAAERPGAPKGGAREGAGRKPHEPDAVTRSGAVWAVIGREIDRATAWHFTRFLPEAMAREALSTVDLLRGELKARLEEIGKGA